MRFLKVGTRVKFTAKIEVLRCPKNVADRKQVIIFVYDNHLIIPL